MPTNIATPIWVCNICGARFDDDQAAAARCESAGVPAFLPDGELLLDYSSYGRWVGSGELLPAGFHLVSLHRLDRLETRATRYNRLRGHVARYGTSADGDQRPSHEQPTFSADRLWPHRPDRHLLNIHHDGHGRPGSGRGLHANHPGRTGELTAWPLDRAGLTCDLDRVAFVRGGHGNVELARPITPEVRAVLTLLRATVDRPRSGFGLFDRRDGQAVIAAEQTSRRDGLPPGVYDPNRAAWWLAQTPEDGLLAEVVDRQDRWKRGEDVTVPMPRLRSNLYLRGRGKLSASKLTKSQKTVIDATGVPWPARTTAEEYLALLLQTRLGVTMTSTSDIRNEQAGGRAGPGLFGSVPICIAATSSKGGVGKSTIAGALAMALADTGRRVLLVDLNLPNPGQHILWGLGPAEADPAEKLIRATRVPAGCHAPQSAGELAVFSHGQLAPADKPAQTLIDMDRAGQWLVFLAGALDLRGVQVIVFDLPPGWDAVHRQVFDPNVLALSAVVHVTTGHPLAVGNETLPGRGHNDRLPCWLVENLSRARGQAIDGSGRVEEIRLYDTEPESVRRLADREQVSYAGSLAWEPDPVALARTGEVATLADAILAACVQPTAAQPEQELSTA
jgi:Mrp family chromosome partitioning ATPase